ncbi:hypothetical protein SAMN05421510_104612 [Nitrosomonas ureae]|uniref:Uncharacterized protein n=1 Tax=Nitrosomonas ureae TaxID=44577 RepID=A0A1H9FNE2_9PROT|nr:hypothetical protein C8R28_100449 [Nitrosomonas ureae]PXX15134.1 hypothetical protein C8R27_11116 [Nitrosomonas ureae]SDT85101.1 hypothetical protein SAMN05216406_10377 [Nitrosomonas ureae]SEQ39404.1 hypothetical protein SAMN05421510_104612 [Nitrosomonas ureae]SOD16290.1 hypothetical protein SAMN06297164_0355 [Nitrosomonas ureae]
MVVIEYQGKSSSNRITFHNLNPKDPYTIHVYWQSSSLYYFDSHLEDSIFVTGVHNAMIIIS